jgi:hypothetical protein
MPTEVMHKIFYESGHDFSGDICPGATVRDLDNSAIEAFRKKYYI